MLTNLDSALGHPGLQMALPGVFPMPLGATFLLALPIPLPPLSADAPAPVQSLEKEPRRTETNDMECTHPISSCSPWFFLEALGRGLGIC